MSNKITILIVEDDPTISNFMETILGSNDYRAITAGTAREALSLISSHCPELVLLDLGLPDRDGLEVLREMRQWTSVPVIVVSARGHEREKVEALDMGADDYIVKPFGNSELLARIRTALRHTITADPNNAPAERFVSGGLTIDFDKRMVTVDENDVHLTQIEYKIVSLLCRNAGRVLTYDSIIEQVWGPYAAGGNQILRVNMANIRRKLEQNPAEPHYIRTEVGVGYRMSEETQ